MVDVKTCLDNAQEKMDMAIMYLEEALAHIRAGKASTRLLDGIRVDSYGSMVPISNVAAVTTPDARSITIKPWDKSMFRVIEKAIIDSDLGIMPENNGEIIRIGIPPLTEERRKQLAKQCKGEGETAKVSVRNARRDGIDALKKAVKDGLAEDENYSIEHNPISMTVTEDIIKGNISIIKHSDDGTTQIETPEVGAEFAVYLKSSGSYEAAKGSEKDYLVCDENGYAATKMLPYGTYIVHQTKGWENTE